MYLLGIIAATKRPEITRNNSKNQNLLQNMFLKENQFVLMLLK